MTFLNTIDKQFTGENVPTQHIHKKEIYVPFVWGGGRGEERALWKRNGTVLLLWQEFSLLHSRGKTDLHTLIRPAFGFSKTHPPRNRSLWLSFPLHASEKNSLKINRFLF